MAASLEVFAQLPEAEAFVRWLEVPGEWVEIPNERRGGMSGVQRIYTDDGRLLYRKQQTGHVYRSLLHPFGYPTVMRERAALLACERLQVPVPHVLFAACRKQQGEWQALLITGGLEDFCSLEDCYTQQRQLAWGEALHLQILGECGRVLGRLNRGRWQHGCLYMKHLFVRLRDGRVEVALIDLEKSRQRWLPARAARHDLSQIRRRSPWDEQQWQAFMDGYRSSYGAAVPALVVRR